MYLIPVTQFLNDVPTSDVSKSVTSAKTVVKSVKKSPLSYPKGGDRLRYIGSRYIIQKMSNRN